MMQGLGILRCPFFSVIRVVGGGGGVGLLICVKVGGGWVYFLKNKFF